MISFIYKEPNLNYDSISLPGFCVFLLQEFKDVPSKEMSNGRPPVRGIEHQIRHEECAMPIPFVQK